jgi:hypothetical protein
LETAKVAKELKLSSDNSSSWRLTSLNSSIAAILTPLQRLMEHSAQRHWAHRLVENMQAIGLRFTCPLGIDVSTNQKGWNLRRQRGAEPQTCGLSTLVMAGT